MAPLSFEKGCGTGDAGGAQKVETRYADPQKTKPKRDRPEVAPKKTFQRQPDVDAAKPQAKEAPKRQFERGGKVVERPSSSSDRPPHRRHGRGGNPDAAAIAGARIVERTIRPGDVDKPRRPRRGEKGEGRLKDTSADEPFSTGKYERKTLKISKSRDGKLSFNKAGEKVERAARSDVRPKRDARDVPRSSRRDEGRAAHDRDRRGGGASGSGGRERETVRAKASSSRQNRDRRRRSNSPVRRRDGRDGPRDRKHDDVKMAPDRNRRERRAAAPPARGSGGGGGGGGGGGRRYDDTNLSDGETSSSYSTYSSYSSYTRSSYTSSYTRSRSYDSRSRSRSASSYASGGEVPQID